MNLVLDSAEVCIIFFTLSCVALSRTPRYACELTGRGRFALMILTHEAV